MNAKTKFFGEITIRKDEIFTFENGIPGFQHLRKFIVIHEENSYFSYLQSLEEETTCFVMTHPQIIVPDYDIEISESTVKNLEIEKPEDVLLYTLLTIPENPKNMTANLKAPIVFNTINKKGVQEIIDDERYITRYRVIKEGDA